MAAVTDTNVYEPHQWKHSTIVAGVEWKNPVGTASGTFQLAACRWFYDVSQMGAICTKGVSPEPWQGNPGPRTAETPAGMVNSVGLQNPGVDHYLVDELPKLKDLGATVITNVAGHSDDEYAEVVAKLADSRADMLEINVSCPNVNHGGMSVGTDPEALHRLIDRLRKITSKPMIVKLSPNVTDITTIARAAVDAGADALSLINTLVGMRIDIRTGEPILSNRTGGVSGPAIFEISRAASCGGEGQTVTLDLLREHSAPDCLAFLQARRETAPALPCEEVLTGTVHNRVGKMLLRYAAVPGGRPLGDVTDQELKALVRAAKGFALPVCGTEGFESAQVTAGGIRTDEFDPATMGSLLVPGLYACGEVLDIDGDCGGYNLQWAWASGRAAGRACR